MFSRRASYEWTAAPGRINELTDPPLRDMHGIVWEFSDALDREVTYSDISRGLGTGADKRGVAGAPDPASADDGEVAPGGSV